MMSGIRGKNTKPEILVRSLLHKHGFRFRLHARDLPGKPDIVLPRYHAVIFVHGCFWHGHDCPLFKLPASRVDFWRKKICQNQKADLKNQEKLMDSGWRVCVIWECSIRGKRSGVEDFSRRIGDWIRGSEPLYEVRR